MKFSKDSKVCFNEENHTYFLGEKRLESVTSFIKKYTNTFDAEMQAEKYAKKHGLNPVEVLLAWQLKGENSRKQGTATHLVFENYCKKRLIEISGIYDKENIAKKFIEDFFLPNRLIPIETEFIVYDEEKAGQIDMIVRGMNNKYFILDFKTNSDIKTDSWGRFLLSPFDNIPDADFYKYSLQVRLYEKMCKEYKIEDCFLIHIKNSDYNFIKPFKFKGI